MDVRERLIQGPRTAAGQADADGYSRAQTFRRFQRAYGEPPMAARRRLLLERAAWELVETEKSVTEIAFDAVYESLEGFSRAFRGAYGVAPSVFRRMSPTEHRSGSRGGLHYVPTAPGVRRQENQMKLLERQLTDHRDRTLGLLDRADAVPSDALDRPLETPPPFPWLPPEQTLREVLVRCVNYAGPWLHAIEGNRPENDSLRVLLEMNQDRFVALTNGIEADGSWDLTFVDADCVPPQRFSYLDVVSHVLHFNAVDRQTAALALDALDGQGHF